MKVGDVRCGQAAVKVEEAKGEGGAAYKLTESFKVAMAEEGQTAIVEYSGTFLLGPDLGLLSGRMRTRSDLTDKDSGKRQALHALLDLTVTADALAWQRSEQKDGAQAPVVKEKKTMALHGVRPVPQNALPGLAAFVMAAGKDGWQPDPRNGLCLPVLNLTAELDGFEIEPFWVSFDMPAFNNPKGTAAQMRARALVGEITDKGFEVSPPSPPVWQAVQLWALDAQCCPLSHPAPEDKRIAVEAADPATLDMNAALDMEKIAAALTANEPKEKKKD
ncbi:MAG: hypothetical protein NTW87_06385 [Planctomycetota bacterium]|nr:hypothetical protein [Planctomycetota bacterium]